MVAGPSCSRVQITKDKSGRSKGYEYTFSATIDAGKFEGQYGIVGKPDSVVYTGSVLEDGTLKLRGWVTLETRSLHQEKSHQA